MMDNNKSYIAVELLRGVLEQIMLLDITPTKIGIRHVRIVFFAYNQETFRTMIELSHIFGSKVYANAFCVYPNLARSRENLFQG